MVAAAAAHGVVVVAGAYRDDDCPVREPASAVCRAANHLGVTLSGSHTGPVYSVAATPGGRYAVSGATSVRVWDTADWSLARTLPQRAARRERIVGRHRAGVEHHGLVARPHPHQPHGPCLLGGGDP